MHLMQAGHHIVLGSRNPIRPPEWLSQAEVTQIIWDGSSALDQSCNGVDVVIHAAGINAQDCASDPVAALAFNGTATARLVAAAIRAGVKKFIYLSTAHVYASPLVGTITEERCPRNLHPYATSHLAGEHTILGASQQRQIQGIVLRLSNVFGAPMHRDVNCWMLLANDLCKQAVQTRKLVLRSSGHQQRDFVSMVQVCHVIEYFAVHHCVLKQPFIFNVGSGVSKSVFALAHLIQQRCVQVLGFEPTIERAQCGVNERQPELIYRTDNLAALGINLNNYDSPSEIDHLLRFCQSTFSQTQRKIS